MIVVTIVLDKSNVAPYILPKPGVTYTLDAETYDFYTVQQPALIKRLMQILGQ